MSAVFAFRAMKKRAEAAEREVARLTETLAAERRATGAEADIEEGRDPLEAARAIRSELVQVHDELLAAERDRDAADALLRRIDDWQGPHGLTVTVMNDIKAHLSGQPAALPCVSGYVGEEGQCNDCGKHHAAPAPNAAESELAALRERVALAVSHLDPGDHLQPRVVLALEVLRGS